MTVTRPNDWLTDVAKDLGIEVLVTPEGLDRGYGANVLFLGTDDRDKVAGKLHQKIPRTCELVDMFVSSSGMLAVLKCKNMRDFEARLTKLRGRLAIRRSEGQLHVWIDSIQRPNKRALVKALKSDPTVESVRRLRISRAQIPLDDIVEIDPFRALNPLLQLDPLDFKDIEIGRAMLEEGYFRVPRPDGLSLDSLANKVGLTKPALLPRMRRLMEAGVRRVLGLEEMTEQDLEAAYQIFKKGRRSA